MAQVTSLTQIHQCAKHAQRDAFLVSMIPIVKNAFQPTFFLKTSHLAFSVIWIKPILFLKMISARTAKSKIVKFVSIRHLVSNALQLTFFLKSRRAFSAIWIRAILFLKMINARNAKLKVAKFASTQHLVRFVNLH